MSVVIDVSEEELEDACSVVSRADTVNTININNGNNQGGDEKGSELEMQYKIMSDIMNRMDSKSKRIERLLLTALPVLAFAGYGVTYGSLSYFF